MARSKLLLLETGPGSVAAAHSRTGAPFKDSITGPSPQPSPAGRGGSWLAVAWRVKWGNLSPRGRRVSLSRRERAGVRGPKNGSFKTLPPPSLLHGTGSGSVAAAHSRTGAPFKDSITGPSPQPSPAGRGSSWLAVAWRVKWGGPSPRGRPVYTFTLAASLRSITTSHAQSSTPRSTAAKLIRNVWEDMVKRHTTSCAPGGTRTPRMM